MARQTSSASSSSSSSATIGSGDRRQQQQMSGSTAAAAAVAAANAKQRKPMCADCEQSLPNQIVFAKIEAIVKRMQDETNGVPVKTAKSFMTKIPSVFTGIDLIQWLMRNMKLDEHEALHLANLIASHGYIFPIEDHTLSIKNDTTFYRFQTPCLWPLATSGEPENIDYAVYLCKRTMQGKARLELADYEAENLARLQKMFARKWELIFLQAESQAKVDKKRDKLERKVLDSQERAFWDVHRPVPGCVNTTELDIKKACRLSNTARKCAECQRVANPAAAAAADATAAAAAAAAASAAAAEESSKRRDAAASADCDRRASVAVASSASNAAAADDDKKQHSPAAATASALCDVPPPPPPPPPPPTTTTTTTKQSTSIEKAPATLAELTPSTPSTVTATATVDTPASVSQTAAGKQPKVRCAHTSQSHHHHCHHQHQHQHHHHHHSHSHSHSHSSHHRHQRHCPHHSKQASLSVGDGSRRRETSTGDKATSGAASALAGASDEAAASALRRHLSLTASLEVPTNPSPVACHAQAADPITLSETTTQRVGAATVDEEDEQQQQQQQIVERRLRRAQEERDMRDLERELELLRVKLDRKTGGCFKMSKVTQSYIGFFKQWAEYDPFISQPIPSNPWVSDSTELWDLERQTKNVHCRRVRRWAFSLKELLSDPAGREQFYKFLEKEFSAENLKFWDAVQELKRVHSKDVARKIAAIWTEYLAPDANCPINIDSKSYETTKQNMAKHKNNRYIFDEAAGHVYQLMKNDSYPRYLRSDSYKDYKEASEKKRTNQVAFDVFKPQITTLKHKFNF